MTPAQATAMRSQLDRRIWRLPTRKERWQAARTIGALRAIERFGEDAFAHRVLTRQLSQAVDALEQAHRHPH